MPWCDTLRRFTTASENAEIQSFDPDEQTAFIFQLSQKPESLDDADYSQFCQPS
jgi:hypothetical protein